MRFPLQKIFLASLALATLCPALTNTSPKPAEPEKNTAPPAAAAATDAPDSAAAAAAAAAAAPASVAQVSKPAVPQASKPASAPPATGKPRAMVIEIRDTIDEPVLYILRRGLKTAEEQKADLIILDMKTPGGSGSVAFDMMEALSKFSGKTITYVNDEAISAGAFIAAATTEIWFAPNGIIGAAAAVNAQGQDIPETMRLKINSFLRAKIRAITEGKGYRGQVVEAMIDKDYELKIDGELIKAKGELLSRTATEAMKRYGDPPQPLLGAGIANSVEEILQTKFGPSNYELTRLEVTWSEKLAQWLNMIKPILMGLGMLALFIEFKTPGFGFFGIAGIALLAVVFLSSYAAGLSGHEPMIVFIIGFILVISEVLFLPGTIALALSGVILMLGSLLWAMADIWPNEPISIAWSTDALLWPFINLVLGLFIAFGIGALIARFLPKGWFFQRIAVTQGAEGPAQIAGLPPEVASHANSLVGAKAIAMTALMPSGQIEIAGRRYDARLDMGHAPAGTRLVVTRVADFSLIVEEDKNT